MASKSPSGINFQDAQERLVHGAKGSQEQVKAIQSTASQVHTAAPKRFIAGAVCPRCGVMDRIVAFVDELSLRRQQCVACGFNEGLDDRQVPAEPETRVTRQHKAKSTAQPLRFYASQPKADKPSN